MNLCRKFSCILILAVFLLTLLPLPVRAEGPDYTFQGDAGNSEYFVITSDATDVILEAYVERGTVPGMELNVASDVTLGLAGVPTTPGEYTLIVYYSTRDHGDFQVEVKVIIDAPGTPVITKHPTGETVVEGDSAIFIARADHVSRYIWHFAIADASLTADELADYVGQGLKVSGGDTDTLVLSNIPLNMSSTHIWCEFVGAEESVSSDAAVLSVTAAKDAKPEVTKNPTDETVEEGGRAVFIAKAKYAQSYAWYLVDPDGAAISITEAVQAFPGLKVSGATTEKLVLENIPVKLDGHRVYCSFTAGSVVSSETARIHVTPAETQPAATTPTEAPTESSEATEAPTESTEAPEPTETPTERSEEGTEATEAPAPEEESKKGNNHTFIIVAMICFAVVAVAGIVAYVILQLRDPWNY